MTEHAVAWTASNRHDRMEIAGAFGTPGSTHPFFGRVYWCAQVDPIRHATGLRPSHDRAHLTPISVHP
jgi:hypothetical protein